VILFQLLFIFSKSASQYIFQSITVNHTSIIIVLSEIISFFINKGTQVAVITISALFVYLLIFGVLLLHIVTVASLLIRILAIGSHTILLDQTMTIFFHVISILYLSSNSITQAGVQGNNPELSHITTFH